MTASSVVHLHEKDDALAEERLRAREIVAAIRDGNREAETALVKRYMKGMTVLVARRIGDDERARDIVQEVFYIAIRKLRDTDLQQPERLAGYLRGIAVRTVQNAVRKRQREPIPVDVDAVNSMPDPIPGQFRQLAETQAREAVREMLGDLKVDRDRDLLMRYYVYDEDKEVICEALGLDGLHFNRVLFRARKRFRKCLEDSGNAESLGISNDD